MTPAVSIGLFSPFIRDPLHPRIESILSCLRSAGYAVQLQPYEPGWLTMSTKLSLGYFDLASTCRYVPALRRYDIVYVQDLQLLPLLVPAKLLGKRVVYETLDHNVHWRFYRLQSKRPWLARAAGVTSALEQLEVTVANRAADAILVNSKMLAEYLGPKAQILYYSSHLESLAGLHDPTLPPALLYLGLFTREKGADDVLALAQRSGLHLYLYGTIPESVLAERVARSPEITHRPRLSSSELRDSLREVLACHSVLGLSLVRGVHKSYEQGEHNKDIDYLAIGAPILGNDRGPTKEKIDAGCGAYVGDERALRALLADAATRRRLTTNARAYYEAHYSKSRFEQQLCETIASLVQ